MILEYIDDRKWIRDSYKAYIARMNFTFAYDVVRRKRNYERNRRRESSLWASIH